MNARREIVGHGAVAVIGKEIAAVGKSREVVDRFPQEQRIDCNGNLLMPGLIDTHVHLAQCMLRGISGRPSGGLPSRRPRIRRPAADPPRLLQPLVSPHRREAAG